MTILRRLATTTTLLPCLLLTACGDNEKPRPPIVSSSSPTLTPSPTESETTVPADETPEAFIRRWIQVDTAMQNTGDTTAFRQLNWQCTDCDAIADRIDGIYRAGGQVKTAGWQLLNLRRKGTGKPVTFEFDVHAAPTTYRESADGPEKHLAGGDVTYLVELVDREDGWKVSLFGQVAR